MKRMMRLSILVLLLVLSPVPLFSAIVDKIVVVVNNEVVTQGEIDRVLGPLYQQYKGMFSGEELIRKLEEARQAIMGQLIEEKLILSEAKKQNIEVDEKEIEAKIEDSRRKFPSNEAFEQALAAQRLSLKELKAKFREQLMSRKMIDQKVGSRIFITPVEIAEYYNNNAKDFSQPEEIKLRNILIRPKENVMIEKTVELVSDLSMRLKAGEDFAELAKKYSEGPGAEDGGFMGYVKRGDLLPEIEGVVFDMKEGETSDIIRTRIGFHFFKLEERKAPVTLSLSEARRSIEEALWMAKMREKSKGWVEELRRHAYIAFK